MLPAGSAAKDSTAAGYYVPAGSPGGTRPTPEPGGGDGLCSWSPDGCRSPTRVARVLGASGRLGRAHARERPRARSRTLILDLRLGTGGPARRRAARRRLLGRRRLAGRARRGDGTAVGFHALGAARAGAGLVELPCGPLHLRRPRPSTPPSASSRRLRACTWPGSATRPASCSAASSPSSFNECCVRPRRGRRQRPRTSTTAWCSASITRAV